MGLHFIFNKEFIERHLVYIFISMVTFFYSEMVSLVTKSQFLRPLLPIHSILDSLGTGESHAILIWTPLRFFFLLILNINCWLVRVNVLFLLQNTSLRMLLSFISLHWIRLIKHMLVRWWGRWATVIPVATAGFCLTKKMSLEFEFITSSIKLTVSRLVCILLTDAQTELTKL